MIALNFHLHEMTLSTVYGILKKENFRAWFSQEMMYYTNKTTALHLLNEQRLS